MYDMQVKVCEAEEELTNKKKVMPLTAMGEES